MNKTQLIEKVADRAGVTRADANKVYDAIFDEISEQMYIGERVMLKGFGTFEGTRRDEHEGRNPRTGEPMTIPASKSARFTSHRSLRDYLNDRTQERNAA